MKIKRLFLISYISIVLLLGIIIGYNPFLKIVIFSRKISHTFLEKNFQNYFPKFTFIDNSSIVSNIDILHYYTFIKLIPKNKSIQANVTIEANLSNKFQSPFVLDFYDNMKISCIKVNNSPATFKQHNNKIFIDIPQNIKSVNISISYSGKPQNLGAGSFAFTSYQGKPVVYTVNEPIFAPTWIPCNDRPDDKALLDMYIENDSSLVSISNGKLIDTKTTGTNKIYHWRTNYPIPTYLFTIYSGKYKIIYDSAGYDKNKIPLQYYVFETDKNKANIDFSYHKHYFECFEKLFGPYPFKDEKYSVTTILWNGGAIENQTATGIGQVFISGDRSNEKILIHELAHSWWGNSVTIKSWKDIWLNEGFASYAVALYYEYFFGYNQLKNYISKQRSIYYPGTLYNPIDNLFSGTIYQKGAWVLHMLRKELGNDIFFRVLRTYYETYKYKNASIADFETVAENISHKELSHFFKQWIYEGTGGILLNYKRNQTYSNGKYITEILIDISGSEYKNYQFPIDIEFISQNNRETKTYFINENKQTITYESESKVTKIVFDPDVWLLAKFNEVK